MQDVSKQYRVNTALLEKNVTKGLFVLCFIDCDGFTIHVYIFIMVESCSKEGLQLPWLREYVK